ncbi:MAG: hypothetical protein LBH32_08940 [Dysgonamonadaceae bacterium]|jgi:hypothetical protein|nr:hypothetical protein [Dysgonamonadaceae bacterium]
MKKIFFAAIVSIALNSCTREYYNEKNEVFVNSETISYTVKSYADSARDFIWEIYEDATGAYYYCDIEEPKLTSEVFEYGIMNAYLSYELNKANILAPLPYSDFIVDNNRKWEEQLSVEFYVGHITFILKYDDHTKHAPYFSSYDFLVRFMW